MLIRLWKDRHDKPSLLEWKAMSATCKTWKNEARHSTHPPYGTPSFSSCVWLSWTPHSKTRIFDGSKREKIHSREPWERVRQCGKPTIRLVRLPKASASQNLQDHLFFSCLIIHPPRFSTQEERESLSSSSDLAEVAIPFSISSRCWNTYPSGRLVTNLPSIYPRPHITYHTSFPYPICLRPSDIHRNRYHSL